jgi:transcriptional regulator with XRE-family HTH domain
VIRKYRKDKKLTLRAVAEKARVSEGFLSQVENSVSSPSVDTLIHICNAMGINAGDLLNLVNSKESFAVVRRADWDDIELPRTGFVTRRFFSPENRTVIDSSILFLEPGRIIPVRKDIKDGQEILCVLQGSLELVRGDDAIQLSEGDTVHFYADPARQFITNKGRTVTVVLWVGTL